jgi:hypothetical protein
MTKYKPKWDENKVIDWNKFKDIKTKETIDDLKKRLSYHLLKARTIRHLIKGYK